MDLVFLLSRPEGKTLEFKRDLSSPEGALKTIVAFANTSGGALLIGIEDNARGVKGVPDVLKEEERLANLIADNISPKLVPSIEVIAWRKTHVLGVEIYPSSNRPHHLNRLGTEEGVFVRVGSTNRRADLVLIEEMRRFSQVSSLDEQPIPELNSEAIDFRAASEFFRQIRKLTRHDLETLRLVSVGTGAAAACDSRIRKQRELDAPAAGLFASNPIEDGSRLRIQSAVEEVELTTQKKTSREYRVSL